VTSGSTAFLTALGVGAGTSTTGVQNTAIGANALNANVSGTSNVAVGYQAMKAFTTGSNNMVLGHNAMYQNTNTSNTVVIGEAAATASGFNGNYAVVIGATAANTATLTGNGPIVIGGAAAAQATTGDYSIFIGFRCGYTVSSGTNNIVIGSFTGVSTGITTGSNNTLMGYQVGTAYTTSESANILIGASVAGVVGESNVLRIGDAGASAVTKAFIGGIYGITTASGTTATVLVSNTGQLGTVSSSARYKKDIQDIDSSNFINLRPIQFRYKSQEDDRIQYGMLAEEVFKYMPEIVNLDEKGEPHNIQYHQMPALLLAEIQKLNKRIEALESKG